MPFGSGPVCMATPDCNAGTREYDPEAPDLRSECCKPVILGSRGSGPRVALTVQGGQRPADVGWAHKIEPGEQRHDQVSRPRGFAASRPRRFVVSCRRDAVVRGRAAGRLVGSELRQARIVTADPVTGPTPCRCRPAAWTSSGARTSEAMLPGGGSSNRGDGARLRDIGGRKRSGVVATVAGTSLEAERIRTRAGAGARSRRRRGGRPGRDRWRCSRPASALPPSSRR